MLTYPTPFAARRLPRTTDCFGNTVAPEVCARLVELAVVG